MKAMNNKNGLMFGIIGLLSGILFMMFYFGLNNNRMFGGVGSGMMGREFNERVDKDTDNDAHMDDFMQNMMSDLGTKQGDDFDKAFLSEMIVHHEGAVDMAKQAQKQAKHQEIIDLSQKIIDAQNSEIEMMKSWQKNWGY